MRPVLCSVRHDPPNSYGDCLRACVASVLDLDSDDVPHFAHDDPSGEMLQYRVRQFLKPFGYAPFFAHYTADALDSILSTMAIINPDSVYLMFAATVYGDHVVVCRGGKVVHDPNWIKSPLSRPGSHGYWSAMILGVM